MANHYKRANGTYCVRVSNGIVCGRQQLVSATFYPPAGANQATVLRCLKEFELKFEKAVHDGIYRPGYKRQMNDPFFSEMPLGDYIRNIYFPSVGERLSPNTLRFYRAVCEQFLIPSYGKVRLCDITHHHLQDFIDFLAYRTERRDGTSQKGLNPATVKRYATVFRSVMSEACRRGHTEENPLRHDSIVYPKIKETLLDVYTPEETVAFCLALEKEPPMTRLLLMTALLLGLRRAELVALTWNDIDFSAGSLTVNKSAYKVKGCEQKLKAPKSLHGNRTVFFPSGYEKVLRKWKCEQDIFKAKQGERWREQNYIFTTNTGDMISVYTPTGLCAEFEKRHGLRHLKLHGLRHTCASLLVAAGTDPETVRDVLGHDSVTTTDIYLHPYDRRKKEAACRLEGILKGDPA